MTARRLRAQGAIGDAVYAQVRSAVGAGAYGDAVEMLAAATARKGRDALGAALGRSASNTAADADSVATAQKLKAAQARNRQLAGLLEASGIDWGQASNEGEDEGEDEGDEDLDRETEIQ